MNFQLPDDIEHLAILHVDSHPPLSECTADLLTKRLTEFGLPMAAAHFTAERHVHATNYCELLWLLTNGLCITKGHSTHVVSLETLAGRYLAAERNPHYQDLGHEILTLAHSFNGIGY